MRQIVKPENSLDAAAAQLFVLRSCVESSIPKPGLVVVTSAKRGDGKSLTAYALAEALSKGGHTVALVEPKADDRNLTASQVEEIARRLRAANEYIVLDADPLLATNITFGLAKVADALLIAVRLGRQPVFEDELLSKMIAVGGHPLLGVVSSTPKAIADFERRRKAGNLPLEWQRDVGPVPARQRMPQSVAG